MASKVPRSRGRPPKGRKRKNLVPSQPLSPIEPSPTSPQDATPPEEQSLQGIALTGDEARYALLAAQSAARMPEGVAVRDTSSQRLFLNAVAHKPTDGWRLVKKMPTEALAPWFDDLVRRHSGFQDRFF